METDEILANFTCAVKYGALMKDGVEAVFWVVSGRVQGVGFRWYTARVAEHLGIRGWVRNTRDGKVEVLAVGSRSSLAVFEERLWQGPAMSHVDNVEKQSTQLEVDNVKSFEIR